MSEGHVIIITDIFFYAEGLLMENNKKQEACQNETDYMAAAAENFKSLAAKINECFKEIHLVGEDGINHVIKEDAVKIEALAAAKEGHPEKTFALIFSYYEKLFDLMNTLIVADEEEFEKLEIVCGHFRIPKRIFTRHFVNYDASMFRQDMENLYHILKNDLM